MKTEEIQAVVDADEMDDETFIKHFELRHPDQLPNLRRFVHTAKRDPVMIETYRKFHDRLHAILTPSMMENPHEHEAS